MSLDPAHIPVSSSAIAVVTTVHLALLLLRAHRNPSGRRFDVLLAPSLMLAATPWLMPNVLGLALGLVLQLGWFAACERLAARVAGSAMAAPAPAPAAAAPARAAPPRPAQGFVAVPVIAVLHETEDVATFRLARPEGLDFAAGQFLTVRMPVDGKLIVRCYSISSAPHTSGYLEISVKRQGLFSGALHATVRPGSTLWVRGPAGGFTYPAGDARPLALLAGGVGITPLISMLRHAVSADPGRPVTLLYSVTTQRDIAFRNELRVLAARHPQATVVVTITRGPHATEVLTGRIDVAKILAHVADPAGSIFMICGPEPMIEAMRRLLGQLGVPPAQVRSEAFAAAAAAAAAPAPAPEPIQAVAAAAEGGPGARFTLRLVASGRTATTSHRETLLEAAEAAGADIPSACRAGVCGTCRTRLMDGRVECQGDALDERDRQDGYILPCVARARGDCALEA